MDLSIAKSRKSSQKKMGRPRVNALPIMVRLRPEELAALDKWIEAHSGVLSRPLAIRVLIQQATGMKERKKR